MIPVALCVYSWYYMRPFAEIWAFENGLLEPLSESFTVSFCPEIEKGFTYGNVVRGTLICAHLNC
jgi:hypothetical protein